MSLTLLKLRNYSLNGLEKIAVNINMCWYSLSDDYNCISVYKIMIINLFSNAGYKIARQ